MMAYSADNLVWQDLHVQFFIHLKKMCRELILKEGDPAVMTPVREILI